MKMITDFIKFVLLSFTLVIALYIITRIVSYAIALSWHQVKKQFCQPNKHPTFVIIKKDERKEQQNQREGQLKKEDKENGIEEEKEEDRQEEEIIS